jgi:hypothetical protein
MGVISNAGASVINDIGGKPTVLFPPTSHELDAFGTPKRQPSADICSNALHTNSAAKGAKEQSTLKRATIQLFTERRVCAVVHGNAGILRRVPADDQIG